MHGTAHAAVGFCGPAVEPTWHQSHHRIIPLSMPVKSRRRTQGQGICAEQVVGQQSLQAYKDSAQRKLEGSRVSECEVCISHWLRCVAGVDAGEEQW